MKCQKKLCLLIILLLIFTCVLAACEQPPEVVTITFTVEGKLHREYIIGHGLGLAEIPEVPQKSGYLANWSISEFSEFYKDTTVTAVYTKNYFKVTFKADNLIIRTTNVTVGGNPSSMPTVPARTGYIATWDITDFTNFTMDTVVNAVYTPIMFDITFVSEGNDDIVRQVAYGGDLTDIPAVPFKEAGLTGVWDTLVFTDITDDMTVEAQYLPKMVNVTFDDEGELTESLLEYNQQLLLPYDLAKDGKIFGGWFHDVDFEQKAVDAAVTDDFTLYAYWISINNQDATAESMFEFTALDGGGYGIAAAPSAVLPEDIILPNSYDGHLITKIMDGGFKNRSSLKTVLLPVGITEVGFEAFYGCSALTSASFAPKNRLTDIGAYAFYGASSLIGISPAKTIKTIGERAFYGCLELSSVDIPQGSALTTIGARAFDGCTDITAMNISPNIITIGDYAFASLYNLVFNFEGLSELEEVGRYAFLNCTKLYTFNPPNVLFIGDGAFSGCSSLSSLTVIGDTPINDYFDDEPFFGTAATYTVAQIIKQRDAQGEYVLDAFDKHIYLNTTRRLPVSLSTITITPGCVEIADNFLNNCVSVRNINIPTTVQSIGKLAFAAEQGDANNLMKSGALSIAEGSNLKEIGANAFLRRTTFSEITFPEKLESIGNDAFRAATNLSSVDFLNADTLKYIGKDAFVNSSWMTQSPNGIVYMAGFALTYKGASLDSDINLTEWADGTRAIAPYAFTGINNIKTVTVPSTVKTVFDSAFYACGGLTSIIIEEGVTSIKDNAFRNCGNLASLTLPESAQDLGKNILSGCGRLSTLTVFGDRIAGEYFGSETYTGSYAAEQTPKKNLDFSVNLNEKYFVQWTQTKDLYGNYPQSYKITLNGAFNAEGKSVDGYVLASISHDIAYAEYYEKDSEGVYSFSVGFTKGSTSNGRTAYSSVFGSTFYIDETSALEDVILVKAHFQQTYQLPLTLKKIVLKEGVFPDRAVEAFAFMNLHSVQEVVLPAGLITIGEGAFMNCTALGRRQEGDTFVPLPLNMPTSLVAIGQNAFKGDTGLLEVTYSPATQLAVIANGAFEGSGLRAFFVPATVGYIGVSAFANTDYLAILQFENSVVDVGTTGEVLNALRIDEFAFSGCPELLNVNIPDRTTSIGAKAFFGNATLSSVIFSAQSRLSVLGLSAFANNRMLTAISLPQELDLDELEGIFDGDGALREIELYNTNSTDYYTATLGMLFGAESFPGSYSAIQNGAVYYIPLSLTTIKFFGGRIPDYMFQNAAAIKIVELENITEIGVSAFQNCTGIEKIDLPYTVTSIEDWAFRGCLALAAINLTQSSLLAEVGEGAFYESALGSFYFPAGVTEIKPYTFYNCAALQHVGIDTVTSVGGYAFYGCGVLTMLDLSEQLEYIGDYAFYDCRNAEIPFAKFDRLLSVGNFAFYNCTGLTVLNAENLEETGIKAYSGAYNLQEITLPGNTALGSVFGSAYYENSYEISQNGIYYLPESLIRVRISSKAVAVPSLAFKDADGLVDIIFHAEVPPILGIGVFENTRAELKLFVPVSVKQSYLDIYAAYSERIYSHPTDYSQFEFVLLGDSYAVKAAEGAVYDEVLYIPAVYEGMPVSSIATGAFASDVNIMEVIIPAGITSIGDAAFENCANLTKVLFEGGSRLETVGKDSFFGCSTLTQIFLPKTVRQIGDYAFAGLRAYDDVSGGYIYSSSLSEVVFEKDSALESIGKYAFYLTKNLESIALPSSVSAIGVAAFSGSGIKAIDFGDNLLLTSIAAETFNDCAGLLSIELPPTIEYIGKNAFKNCVSLVQAELGIRLEEIAERAFYACYALAEISFPVTLVRIGNESFRFCSTIESVTLPQNVNYLGDYSFCSATSLYEVIWYEEGVGNIGEHAFMDTPWLAQKQAQQDDGVIYINNIAYAYKGEMPAGTTLTLREGTVGISPRAFENGHNLIGVTIPATVLTIGDSAFRNCPLENVIFEEGSSLQSIGNRAFEGTAFTSLTLPDSLKNIGNYAFYGNTALEDLNLPSALETIGQSAFMDLTGLVVELTLPDSVVSVGNAAFKNSGVSLIITADSALNYIGSRAFEATPNLTAIIPTSITAINDAFYGTNMQQVFIPSWVTEISDFAFMTSAIGEIRIASSNSLIKIGTSAFEGLISTVFYLYGLTNLKTIGERAFYGCALLERLVADSVSSIGISAFEGCSSLAELTTIGKAVAPLFGVGMPESLARINIAAGVVSISESAFEGADYIVSVYLPATLKTISRYAFKDAASLELINLEIQETLIKVGREAFSGTKWLADKPSGMVYIGKIAYLYKGQGASASLLSGTTALAEYAFSGNTSLTSITLPSSVSVIGEMAFEGCSALTTFTLASGSVLKTIGMRAFYNCSALTAFAIPLGIVSIAEEAFAGCSSLASLSYNGSVNLGYLFGRTSFDGSYAAEQNGVDYYIPSSLKNLRFIDNSTTIADYCLQNVSGLATVIAAISIKEIGSYAFDGCDGLTQLTIIRGSLLEEIGDFAFRNCSGLTTLYLPSTVISVGTGILSGLSALTELTVSGAYRLAELMGMDSYVDSYAVTYAENTYYLPLSLKSIIIADGTESIIADAYASSLIESVSLPTGLKIVGERAFAGAIQLTSVIQPTENNTIEEILAYAFSDCTELTAIILYENVTKIGERAFYDCSAMEAVHILSPYCEIGYQAFYNTPWYGHQNGLIYAGNTLLGYSGPVPEGYSLLVEDGTTDIAANAFDSQSGLVAVTLPASIQSIGKAAFKNCLNLTEVEFIGTSQLEEISAQQFYNCQRLESFEIPASIKKIGDSAFYNCRAFDVVVFGNGSLLTELGNEAFMQCAAVAAYLPSSLKTIGAYAFSNCQALENIAMISASALEYIGEYAFYGAKNAVFGVTTFGALSYIGTRAFYSCEKIISVVAPSLEYIGEEAFKNCLAITTLTLTADVRIFDLVGYADNDVSGTMYGVVSYGGEQYSVPVSLTTVHFAQNAVSVKDYALYGAEDILTVSLSAAVVEIGASAFENCALLVTVEGGSALQKIDVGAFRNCSSLSSFDLPASIKTIEDFAFENCTGMTALSLAGNSLLTKIGVGAFQNAGNAVFTFGAITKPLTVGADAFKNCRSLENFVAENVIYYGDGAFDGCDALVSITVTTDGFVGRLFGTEPNAGCYVVNMSATDYYIPLSLTDIFVSQSMSTVADNAFAGLNTIEYVWLNGVSAIGKRAFLGNSALTTITVPASVVIIDDFAFEGCINLESVTLMLADTLTFIGEAAFDDTQWYADIISGVTNDTVYIGKVAYAHIGSISGVLALRSDSIGISPKAFINQTGITELRLPLSMSAIGANAFQNCSSIEALYTTGNFEIGRLFGNQPYGLSYSAVQNGLTYYIPQALKRVFVISGASQLAAQAFAGCYSLTSVSLPVTLYNIGADTMKGCHGLTEMTAPAEFMLGTFFGIDAYENSYSASQNGVNYYFPASLRTVTALGEEVAAYAYQNLTSLTSISIPTSVTRLSSYALYGCSGLTEIFLHAGITLIDDFALAMCSGISSVTLPSGATLGAGALSGCSALNSLTLKGILPLHNLFGTVYYDGSYQVRQGNKYYYLPEALTMLTIRDTAVIADSLLEGFSAVSTLTLPTDITRVGNYAFYGLQLLNELALPATLTEVGDFAFYDNKKVNFIIPTNNIQTVGRGAFQNCYALVSFNTPSVISIGAGAFSGCYALASLGIRMGKVVGEYFGQQMYVGSYAAVQRIGEVDMTYYIPSALTQITVYGGGALSAYMLANMSKLNTVSLLGETSIPATAFIGCTAVTSLTGADIVYIEKDALLPLPWLATHIASRPNNTLVYIGRVAYVFKGVMDIGANISFIDGTTQLYAGAFANQSRLIRVNVPSSMCYIDITAFDGCTAMNYITVDAANEYFSSLSGILYNKAGDTLIYRPLAMA